MNDPPPRTPRCWPASRADWRAACVCGWLLGVLLLVPQLGAAQRCPANPRYALQQMGDDVGLTTRTATSLLQDRHGFLWVGTQDGLVRYDGINTVDYGKSDGLPSGYVEQLLEAADGTLWIATMAGVVRFDGAGFTPVEGEDPQQRIRRDRIWQRMALDAQQRAYVASAKGLMRYDADGRHQRSWSAELGLTQPEVRAVHVAADDTVWLASGSQVVTLDAASEAVAPIEIPTDEIVLAITSDASSRIWIRTNNHLLRRDPGAAEFSHDDEALPPVVPDWGEPVVLRDETILVPSTEGLCFKRQGRWHCVGEGQGLTSDTIHAVLEDREGALWLALPGCGLCLWPWRRGWSAWTTAEGLPSNMVWGMVRDHQQRLWVATNDGVGIWDPADQSWHIRRRGDGLVGSAVRLLAVARDGAVWALSIGHGIMRFDPATLEPHPVSLPGEARGDPTFLAATPDGRILVASFEYLYVARTHEGAVSFEAVPNATTQAEGCLRNAAAGSADVLWTSGPKGLARFDGSSWRRFTTADGLLTNFAHQLVPVSGDEIWFTYRDFTGVTRLELRGDAVDVRHFGKAEGLPSDTVYMVGVDARGRTWTGGNAGLAVISPDSSVRVFNRADGLIWEDINSYGFLAEPDGAVFIGTSRGLAHYDPQRDRGATEAPSVTITSATLGGVERRLEPHAVASWNKRNLTVAFSCLSFRNPKALRFRYRLTGLQDEYVQTDARQVGFQALPAGRYQLDVICGSAGGAWSETPASFAFTIEPPWWATWWARAAGGGLLVVVIIVVVRLRTAKLEADRRRLEAAVAERSAQLDRVNRELREMSHTDPLTGARNRRYFSEIIGHEVARVLRRFDARSAEDTPHNRSLAFFMVDLDYFKRVNDEHGHLEGDRVLAEVVERFRRVVRESDLIVRWGGEEFLIVSRDCARSELQTIAERVLDATGAKRFELGTGKQWRGTCSIGWATFPWMERDPRALTYEQVIELADRALFLAKESGRNRAVGVSPRADGDSPSEGWLETDKLDEADSPFELTIRQGPAPSDP